MVEAVPPAGPGRPSTGARERLLRACVELLKSDGYARLTTAKVAQRSGDNKALISYYFGSKEGMITEATSEVSKAIKGEFLESLDQPRSAEELAGALVDGFWGLAERNQALLRVYFDLASNSVVETEVREILRATRAEQRRVLMGLLQRFDDRPPAADLEALAVYLIAVLEGLSLERLERRKTRSLRAARQIFTHAAATAIRASATRGAKAGPRGGEALKPARSPLR